MSYHKKAAFNVMISLAGIAIAFLHIYCTDSCSFLKGSVFGFALDYLGIAYMCVLIVSYLARQNLIFLLLLSAGVGAEAYLLGFQVNHNVYCYYCLAFGALLLILFLLNFERSRKTVIAGSLVLGFLLFSIFFEGSVTPAYAEELPLPTFGTGRTQVRLYTDYFCAPCRALEPQLEPAIKSLVRKGVITVMFVDTPVHPHTTLYAKYFLYALNAQKDAADGTGKKALPRGKGSKVAANFDEALRIRSVLFDAAKENVTDKEKLEGFVRKRGVEIRPFDAKPVFDLLSNYLKEDQINSTPTCVIYQNGKKERFIGPAMLKALEALR